MNDTTSEVKVAEVLYGTNTVEISNGTKVAALKVTPETLLMVVPFLERNIKDILALSAAGNDAGRATHILQLINRELTATISVIAAHTDISGEALMKTPLEDIYTICEKLWEVNSGFFMRMVSSLESMAPAASGVRPAARP